MTQRLQMTAYVAPSLAARQDLVVVVEVPSQRREATVWTIKDWAHRHSTAKITDLFYVTTSSISLRDPNHHQQVTKIFGLSSSVKMHHHNSLSSGSVLRYARGFAESNRTARVLVVSSEITSVVNFHHTRAHVTPAPRRRASEDAAALYIKDLQRRNHEESARLRKVQEENDRLRADKITLLKKIERDDKARRSHRCSSASTQVPKWELFLSISH